MLVYSQQDCSPTFGLPASSVEVTFHLRGFSPPWCFSPSKGCGLIASHNRSWGSLRFSSSFDVHPRQRGHPSESFLRRQPYRVTAAVTFLTLPSNCTRAFEVYYPVRGSSRASCCVSLPPRRPPCKQGLPRGAALRCDSKTTASPAGKPTNTRRTSTLCPVHRLCSPGFLPLSANRQSRSASGILPVSRSSPRLVC